MHMNTHEPTNNASKVLEGANLTNADLRLAVYDVDTCLKFGFLKAATSLSKSPVVQVSVNSTCHIVVDRCIGTSMTILGRMPKWGLWTGQESACRGQTCLELIFRYAVITDIFLPSLWASQGADISDADLQDVNLEVIVQCVLPVFS